MWVVCVFCCRCVVGFLNTLVSPEASVLLSRPPLKKDQFGGGGG